MSGAAVPIMGTRSVNDLISSALWNAQVRDPINFLLNLPLFEGYQTSAQSTATGANTPVALDTNSIDTYSGHSTTVNNTQYFAQLAGYYAVRGLVTFAANATGVRFASIAYNGSTIVRTVASCNAVGSSLATGLPTGMPLVFMNVGDYVQLQATQTSGGALNLVTGESFLNLEFVHA